MTNTYITTLSCPDRPGIVHAVSGALLEAGGNIIESAQFRTRSHRRSACGVGSRPHSPTSTRSERSSLRQPDASTD